VGLGGFTESCVRITVGENVAPPLLDSYSPISAEPGGVNRPPLTEDEPCRATSVPMKI